MGFFGELKQDLSQVAGDARKKSEAESEADKILAEAELVGMDEADAALNEAAEEADADDNDDVSSLLKDLVSDLGGDDLHAEDIETDGDSTDIDEDLDAILAGLSTDEIVQEESNEAAMPGGLEDALAEFESLTDSPESETVIKLPDEKPAASVSEEAAEPEAAIEEPAAEAEAVVEEAAAEISAEEISFEVEEIEEEITDEPADIPDDMSSALDEAFASLDQKEEEPELPETEEVEEVSEDEKAYEELKEDVSNYEYKGADAMETGAYSEETSVITGGMVVNGDVESEGSLDLVGKVHGDVTVKGKLNVTGHIVGNSEAKEVFAENAKITGNVTSESSVKIGAGTVIVGNITAFSAAIAGAVKGDIDVHGPVILDSTAIVMGNIRSKSVQINNGAALEGVCSQAYAEVSPTAFFDDYKPETKPEKKSAKKKEEA